MKAATSGLLMPPEVAGDLWLALNRQATTPPKFAQVNQTAPPDPLTQQERELYNELTYFLRRLAAVERGFVGGDPKPTQNPPPGVMV